MMRSTGFVHGLVQVKAQLGWYKVPILTLFLEVFVNQTMWSYHEEPIF